MKQKFYKRTWFILLFLIIFPPIGISLLWINKKFGKALRTVLTIFSAFIFIIAVMPINKDNFLTDEEMINNNQQREIPREHLTEEEIEEIYEFVDKETTYIDEPILDEEIIKAIEETNNSPMYDNSESTEKSSEKVVNKSIENLDSIKYNGKSYKIIEVDGGNLSGERESSVAVDVGFGDREYWALTNKYGQLVYVIADEIILQNDDNETVTSDGRYYRDEAKVPGTELDNLDEGHVIADSLGGVSNAYNITPQESTLNRHGDQAYMEKVIRDAGGCKNFVATITYPDKKTQIPSHYKYEYVLKGKKIVDEFDNVNPDEVNASLITKAPKKKAKTDNNQSKIFNEEKELKKIDTNNNGKVTIAEAKKVGYKMPIYSDNWLYKYMDDRDKDGVVGE